MSKLYRQYVRDQEVYNGKDFSSRAQERKEKNVLCEACCQKCKDILDISLLCDDCLRIELDTQEEYYQKLFGNEWREWISFCSREEL